MGEGVEVVVGEAFVVFGGGKLLVGLVGGDCGCFWGGGWWCGEGEVVVVAA